METLNNITNQDHLLFGVYRIKNKFNNKVYVGSTVTSFEKRWGEHTYSLNLGKHANYKLQRDWRKYGPNAFIFEILEIVYTKDQIFVREQHWINQISRHSSYNIMKKAGDVPKSIKKRWAAKMRKQERTGYISQKK